jgi:hypothetical protein
MFENKGLTLVLGLRKSDWGLAVFPLATLLEEFDALEALEDGTLAADGGIGLEAVVLGHLEMRLKIAGGGSYGPDSRLATRKRNFFRISSAPSNS